MSLRDSKYIFVTGGVLSGLGKGITAAAMGNILKARGFKVHMQKLDQYFNVDAGTLNPAEHGEVFVTDDGAETDLDLGHYERFLDTNLDQSSSIMSGNIFESILAKERAGKFLGKTIQMIPHVTNEVKEYIFKAARKSKADINIIEIGGTVGDYEGAHFLEAIRQLRIELGSSNVIFAHIAYLPYLPTSKEIKTKPLQNSVRDLREIGIPPDIIAARSDHPVNTSIIKKISLFTDVPEEGIVPLVTAKTVYEVPLILRKHHLDRYLLTKLNLKIRPAYFQPWEKLVEKIKSRKKKVKIGIVGKYLNMEDTYLSVTEALKHACWQHNRDLDLFWINAEKLVWKRQNADKRLLRQVAGIVVPGGFGKRGFEGKIAAIHYCRHQKVPFLGLCLGLQLAIVEFARHVAGLKEADTEEANKKTKYPVIHYLHGQKNIKRKGGTMRLGAYPCVLNKDSLSYKAYKLKRISERHRHRLEVNNKYCQRLIKNGLVIAGTLPDKSLVEIIELRNHPWFVAVQFHPEFKSRPLRPHPLFIDFIGAAIHNIKN